MTRLQTIERELSSTLIEREEVIRAALIALLARQHLVILGPPGTAKSQLVTALASRISPPGGAGLKSFTHLMTRFTTPEELFGPVSVQALKQDEYRRVTTGRLVEAELVFLDEIFKASSAILNALLKITSERSFSNGNQELTAPLLLLFGASNELPQGNEPEALWDRFLLRMRVGYLSDSGFARLMRAASDSKPEQRQRVSHAQMRRQPFQAQFLFTRSLSRIADRCAVHHLHSRRSPAEDDPLHDLRRPASEQRRTFRA